MINCIGAGEVLSFIAPTRPLAVLAGACSRFRNVRLWHKADIDGDDEQCPLSGAKRTSLMSALMSANDPKRTLAFQNNILFYPRKH